MIELDVLVIADRRSPVARAYLSYLNAGGYAPKDIVLVDFFPRNHKFSKLCSIFGERMSLFVYDLYRYVSRFKSEARGIRRVGAQLTADFDVQIDFDKRFDFKKYSKSVKSVAVNNFEDDSLMKLVRESTASAAIFTGGGIVKSNFINDCGKKILHVHPGTVPDVKGADGILWSALVREKLGYSLFFMNEGIDTGDVLRKQEFDLPSFSCDLMKKYGNNICYRALLDFYDPHMRASLLAEEVDQSIKSGRSLWQREGRSQDPNQGRVYHFMHRDLKNKVLKMFFNSTH
ncbi:formyltransferase family protein [Motiliproteus sp.]|uniref:formyltransferase family protein n=1 Tax=Motiliproteus sp. TaxID=1898955 RepID=UPI003BAD2EB8